MQQSQQNHVISYTLAVTSLMAERVFMSDIMGINASGNAELSRRDLLRLAGTAVVFSGFSSANSIFPASETVMPRTAIELTGPWKFIRKDVTGAEAPDFNDAGWANVSLPHTWNNIDALTYGGKKASYYRGPGWYRLHLTLPPEFASPAELQTAPHPPNKSYFLYFDGAGTVADVYVNGVHLGQHRGPFAGFTFDATKQLNPTGDNVIAVKVDNTRVADVPPLSGDFNIYGGLYRPARLLILNPVSISPLDFGSSGVYLLQKNVSQEQATIQITTMLRNAIIGDQNVTVVWNIFDGIGDPVATLSVGQTIPAGATTAQAKGEITIPNPHLWNGRIDPYMYQVVTQVLTGSIMPIDQPASTAVGILDEVIQPLGLRYFHVDPDTGFYLNGQPYRLHGVNAHQDRPGEGLAATNEQLAADIGFIHEVGARSVRLAHYQHAQAQYDACDRLGIIVWAEDGLVNSLNLNPVVAGEKETSTGGSRHGHGSATTEESGNSSDAKTPPPTPEELEVMNKTLFPTPAFTDNARQQLTELVKQNFNHPSICFWSLFNELGFSFHKKDYPTDTPGPKPWDLIGELNLLTHQLDPTRLTTSASNHDVTHPMSYQTDIMAFNRYPGWYGKGSKVTDWPKVLDTIRTTAKKLGRCAGISEYGYGANVTQHEYPVTQPQPTGKVHPEEWQCIGHEAAYAQMKERPWLWNTLLWVMFDFAVQTRDEGDTPARNDKGLMTYDRKTRKDAFYFYKASWTPEPMVYITDRRFNPRQPGPATLKVYSNCPTVELFVNGVSLGQKSPTNDVVFTWPESQLATGSLKISAVATGADGKQYTDEYTVKVSEDAPVLHPEPAATEPA